MAQSDPDDIEEDLEEVLRATRADRRMDALKLLGGGLGGIAIWAGVIWGIDPTGYEGIDRTFLYVAGFGALGIGVLLTLFAVALFAHSFVLKGNPAED
ncbi:MAG: hypothetical protein ABEL76_11195 [Bradymonadaceae bacterium]